MISFDLLHMQRILSHVKLCGLSFAMLMGLSSWIIAQPADLLEGIDPTDFYAIQQTLNTYYDENPKASGYKQWKRREYYLQTRLGERGQIINSTQRNINEWAKYQKTHAGNRATTHGGWIFYGPHAINDPNPNDENGSGLGRLNVIKIHPTNASIIYVGAASGGIWKSTNGGSTWSNISPYLPSLAIKDIVIDPSNPEDIFVLTGDNLNSINPHPSIGIIRSLNGGASWTTTNAPVFSGATHKLLMHPSDPATQYAATQNGLYKTTNRWSTSMIIKSVEVFDVELKPDDPSTIYVATQTNIEKKIGSGGWNTLTDADFSSWPSFRFIRIAVTPDEPECIYAFVAENSGPTGLYRSMNAGANNTWTVQDETLFPMGGNAFYNMSLEVKGNDYEDITLGMIWTGISRSGGTPGSWVRPTNYVHADVHHSLFRNPYVYHCNDGGLFRSTPGDSIFDDLSAGLEITEIYGIAGTPMDVNLYYCGTQDNGTNKRTNSNTFDQVAGSDGGNCMIDYLDEDNVYATYQNGFLIKSTNGGNSFSSINPPGIGFWVSPLLMDPVDPEIIFIGKDTLFRSDAGGSSWVNLGKPVSNGSFMRALAQGKNNRERLYASNSRFASQKLYRIDNAISSPGNPVWTNITNELPDGTITGLTVNPENANHVYACLSNISPSNKVFRSLASGNNGSWENITGSLPNVPINCIEFHDNGDNNNPIYIGTDIGVFYRDDDLGDWVYFSNLMPVVNVLDIYINTTANIIAAGTYGRGIWISSTYNGCDPALVLSSDPGQPVGGVRYYSASDNIESTAEYRSDLGTDIYYSGGNYLDLKVGFQVGGYGFFNGKIGPCPSEAILQDIQVSNPGNPFAIETWHTKFSQSD